MLAKFFDHLFCTTIPKISNTNVVQENRMIARWNNISLDYDSKYIGKKIIGIYMLLNYLIAQK